MGGSRVVNVVGAAVMVVMVVMMVSFDGVLYGGVVFLMLLVQR